jgi:medium-chain acyl-[acyl-carrier-protein] hydrolase
MTQHRPPADRWTVISRPNTYARMRLYCFPYAGGGATIYAPWPRLLPQEVEVVAVQPPGRETRIGEKPFTDLASLVEAMHAALLPKLRELPFAFFGHSNGALMAFELARLLRRRGDPLPLHLFVSGRPAPQLELDDPPVHDLPEPEFIEELRRLKGTPEEILQHEELLQLVVPLLRADFSLGETYRFVPEAPLEMPVSAYGGVADAEVSEEQVEAWKAQAGGEFRAAMFPGGHFFVNEDRERVTREVADALRPALDSPAVTGVYGF